MPAPAGRPVASVTSAIDAQVLVRRTAVVGKAEYLPNKANPRFVVTNLPIRQAGAKRLYEKLYCVRGEMENRIKEQQLGCSPIAPALRPCGQSTAPVLLSFAYVLMHG